MPEPIQPIDSVLDSTKKTLGLDSAYDAFDMDIILHINSVFTTLHQLGVGPSEGFMIDDKTDLWSSYSENSSVLNMVKSYMYVRVRLLFDPPTTSFSLESFNKQAQEYEWRLNVLVDPNQDKG